MTVSLDRDKKKWEPRQGFENRETRQACGIGDGKSLELRGHGSAATHKHEAQIGRGHKADID